MKILSDIKKSLGIQENPLVTKEQERYQWQRAVIRIAAGAISGAMFYMSLSYTFAWFSKRAGVVESFLMSFGIVMTILIGPQLMTAAAKRKQWMIAMASGLLFIPTILFSMSTTVDTLYSNYTNTRVAVIKNNTSSEIFEVKIATIQKSILSIEKRIELSNEQLERLYREYEEVERGSKREATIVARINLEKKAIEQAQKDLASAVSQLEAALSENAPAGKTLYMELAAITGIPAETIELMALIIPAVFTDIISPIMMGAALFL